MLYVCPTCSGRQTITTRKQSKRKGDGDGDEETEQDCPTCDGAGKIEKPPG